MSPHDDPLHDTPRLNGANYVDWDFLMQARLRSRKLWRIVSGEKKRPSDPPANASAETKAAIEADQGDWDDLRDAAAGQIAASLDASQRIHIEGIFDDPVKMWATLKAVHSQQKPAARMNAIAALMNEPKQATETLMAFDGRMEALLTRLISLAPGDYKFTDAFREIKTLATVRNLGAGYETLQSTLLYGSDLSAESQRNAFMAKDLEEASGAQSLLLTRAVAGQLDIKPVSTAASPASSSKWCELHQATSHNSAECTKLQQMAEELKRNRRAPRQSPQPETAKLAAVSAFPATTVAVRSAHDWIADTGATAHMTPHKSYFVDYKADRTPIEVAQGARIFSVGVGSAIFRASDGKEYTMAGVLHVPALACNLFSVHAFTAYPSARYEGDGDRMRFYLADSLAFTATLRGKLAFLDGACEASTVGAAVQSAFISAATWHRRLGHISMQKLKQIQDEDLATGFKLTGTIKAELCEPCILGKHHRDPFPSSTSRATQRLQLIHTDLHELPQPSAGGCRYWVTFIDDFSRYAWFYPLKHKSDVYETFASWQAMVENQTELTVKVVRDDKGGEYEAGRLQQLYRESGILRQRTATATPQQNGVAERLNRTTEERLIAMLQDAGLPHRFWGEALATYAILHNVCPSKATPGSTPFQLYHKRKPNLDNMRVFGCKAYVHILKAHRKHLDPHSRLCTFIGYDIGMKAWRFYDATKGKTIMSRDAIFLETGAEPAPADVEPQNPTKSVHFVTDDDDEETGARERPVPVHEPVQPEQVAPAPQPLIQPNELEGQRVPGHPGWRYGDRAPPAQQEHLPTSAQFQGAGPRAVVAAPVDAPYTTRSGRPRDPELRAQVHDAVVAMLAQGEYRMPKTYKEAMALPDWERWDEAFQAEFWAQILNGTWELVDLPEGRKAVGSRWVCDIKLNADGTVERYKVRLVGQGYSQIGGIDFDEIFAPVAKWESMRTILAIAATMDWEIHQIDFTTAFLNSPLVEEIYLKQAEGFEQGRRGQVYRLKRALPGLRQGSRAWYIKLDSVLRQIGFVRCESDHSIYKINRAGHKQILSVYVDDEIIAGSSLEGVEWTKAQLRKHLDFKDRGEAHFMLGIEIHRDRPNRKLYLSQSKHVNEVLDRFDMSNCRPVATPLDTKALAPAATMSDEERGKIALLPYIDVVGSLNYLATCTRPDIAFAVGTLGQFSANPSMEHWQAAKRVLRYLRGTSDFALQLGGTDKLTLQGYSDADYAGDIASRRSTSGYAFFVGSALVSWRSKKQSIVALSTTEAEYIAAVAAGQEGVALRSLLAELD